MEDVQENQRTFTARLVTREGFERTMDVSEHLFRRGILSVARTTRLTLSSVMREDEVSLVPAVNKMDFRLDHASVKEVITKEWGRPPYSETTGVFVEQ